MAPTLLEQWQQRALAAEAKIAQAIDMLKRSGQSDADISVQLVLDILKRGAYAKPVVDETAWEPKFNTEGVRTGRLSCDKENVAGISKSSPWGQAAEKKASDDTPLPHPELGDEEDQ